MSRCLLSYHTLTYSFKFGALSDVIVSTRLKDKSNVVKLDKIGKVPTSQLTVDISEAQGRAHTQGESF